MSNDMPAQDSPIGECPGVNSRSSSSANHTDRRRVVCPAMRDKSGSRLGVCICCDLHYTTNPTEAIEPAARKADNDVWWCPNLQPVHWEAS